MPSARCSSRDACAAGRDRARARRGQRFSARPGGRPDDAVGGQPVAALEALDRALGLRAEDAVRVQAEGPLDERDAGPLGALLERRAQRPATRVLSTSASSATTNMRPRVRRVALPTYVSVCSLVRPCLRGELSGSRSRATPPIGGDSPRGHRCAASVPPFAAPGGAAIRRASFYQSKSLLLQDFLQTAGCSQAPVQPQRMGSASRP